MSATVRAAAAPPPTDSLPAMLRAHAAVLRGHVWLAGDMNRYAETMDHAATRVESDDDARAVRLFATLMTLKLREKSAQGRHGWTNVPVAHLWAMLRESVAKGDPIDIANFAMMIHANAAAARAPARQGDAHGDA